MLFNPWKRETGFMNVPYHGRPPWGFKRRCPERLTQFILRWRALQATLNPKMLSSQVFNCPFRGRCQPGKDKVIIAWLTLRWMLPNYCSRSICMKDEAIRIHSVFLCDCHVSLFKKVNRTEAPLIKNLHLSDIFSPQGSGFTAIE